MATVGRPGELGSSTDQGIRTEVSQQTSLARSHSLVWGRDGAEIRDQNGRVIFTGTKGECVAEAKRCGLYHGQ